MTPRSGPRPDQSPPDPSSAARDRAHGLLRELLADVERDQAHSGAPAGSATSPSQLEAARDRKRRGRGPVVGLVVVGALSFGGVAAAATQAPPTSALHALGGAVRSVAAALGAGAPTDEPRKSAPSGAPQAAAVPAEQGGIEALLRRAAELLDAGRPGEAAGALALADSRLAQASGLAAAEELRATSLDLRRRLPPGLADPVPGVPATPGSAPAPGPSAGPDGPPRAELPAPAAPAAPPAPALPAVPRAPAPAPPAAEPPPPRPAPAAPQPTGGAPATRKPTEPKPPAEPPPPAPAADPAPAPADKGSGQRRSG